MTESSGFSLTSFIPFLNIALGSNNNHKGNVNSANRRNMNRALGAAATLGLSFAILKFVANTAKIANDNEDSNGRPVHSEAVDELLKRSEVLFQLAKTFLRKMVREYCKGLLNEETDDEADEEEEENDVPMIHRGYCHCRSVGFELVAPRKILYRDGEPGKIQYRHARVRGRSFRFVKGERHVKTYYVNKASKLDDTRQQGNDEVGAHSFCSRCGVHILHAPNSNTTALDVNVNCLNQGALKLKKIPAKDGKLSAGFAVSGQWDSEQQDTGRYPTTIVEGSSSMTIFPPVEQRSQFSGLQQHHPLLRSDEHDLDSLYGEQDTYNTEEFLLPGETKVEPDTPSTIYTSQTQQTESLISSCISLISGVPPTLTLDTRDCSNDTESVASFSSSRSCFQAGSEKYGAHQQSSTSLSSTTAPMMRHQMKYYMQKHMSSSSALSTSSSLMTPTSRTSSSKTPSVSCHATGINNNV